MTGFLRRVVILGKVRGKGERWKFKSWKTWDFCCAQVSNQVVWGGWAVLRDEQGLSTNQARKGDDILTSYVEICFKPWNKDPVLCGNDHIFPHCKRHFWVNDFPVSQVWWDMRSFHGVHKSVSWCFWFPRVSLKTQHTRCLLADGTWETLSASPMFEGWSIISTYINHKFHLSYSTVMFPGYIRLWNMS